MTGGTNESIQLILLAQQGDMSAQEALVKANLPLVKFVIKRYTNRGLEYDDLYQLGCLGLLKAIRNFDVKFEVQFSTYAVPVILGEVRRYIRDNGLIRVSRSIRENAMKIHKFREKYEQQNASEPTISQISEALGISREDTLLALDSMQPARSLSEPVGTDGSLTLQDVVGSDPTRRMDDSIALEQMLSGLSEKERIILKRRYFARHTQARIAQDLGMTQVQVSRLEGKILKRLRDTHGEAVGQ